MAAAALGSPSRPAPTGLNEDPKYETCQPKMNESFFKTIDLVLVASSSMSHWLKRKAPKNFSFSGFSMLVQQYSTSFHRLLFFFAGTSGSHSTRAPIAETVKNRNSVLGQKLHNGTYQRYM